MAFFAGLYYGGSLQYLHPWEDQVTNNVTVINAANETAYFEMFAQPVRVELYMTCTIGAASVAVVAFVLLLHLSMFHIYINYVGITTYEYVRSVRLSMEKENNQANQSTNTAAAPQINNQNAATSHNEAVAEKKKWYHIFTKKSSKVGPSSSNMSVVQNGNGTNHQNGGPPSSKKLTDEKLPPIHPPTPKSPKHRNKKVIDKGSSVPKLPKLVEESNMNNEQLTKINEHLEKMEDQDKIYVIEVK